MVELKLNVMTKPKLYLMLKSNGSTSTKPNAKFSG